MSPAAILEGRTRGMWAFTIAKRVARISPRIALWLISAIPQTDLYLNGVYAGTVQFSYTYGPDGALHGKARWPEE